MVSGGPPVLGHDDVEDEVGFGVDVGVDVEKSQSEMSEQKDACVASSAAKRDLPEKQISKREEVWP